MRISSFFIILAAACAVGAGAYFVGHAASQPAHQLDAVESQPAQAASVTAAANLTAAVSAASSYYLDHDTYAGMTTRDLRSYDKDVGSGVSVQKATGDSYCVESTYRSATVSITGPDGTFVSSGC
jgi:hypothetical protein